MKQVEWVGTGVFATGRQAAEINEKVEAARNAPVISFGGGPDAASVMWHEAKKFVDRCAIKSGLPGMKKFRYGINLETMEFYKPMSVGRKAATGAKH